MGRKRLRNVHLPRYMVKRHGAYYLVRRGKYTRLAAEYGPALIAYAALVGERPQVTTVADAIAHYLESSAKRLSAATLEGYRQSAANVIPVFGGMALTDVTAAHVYRYLIERGNVQANRDRALLSVAYTHARRIGAFAKLDDDPTKGLEYRNPEPPRQRYVTDDEETALLAAASPKVACIAQFLHLTAMRQSDALRVRLDDLTDEGIAYTSGKTGKRLVVEWTPALRACVNDANRLWRRFGREWLFESKPRGKHAKRGYGPYTPSGLRALWRGVRTKAELTDVRLHDLRRKAGSDLGEDHAQRLLGHADAKVTRRHYRAKVERVKPAR